MLLILYLKLIILSLIEHILYFYFLSDLDWLSMIISPNTCTGNLSLFLRGLELAKLCLKNRYNNNCFIEMHRKKYTY